MKKLENNKGITLLALVITIVILIILATASMLAIFGENGLMQSTEKGRDEHQKAEAREQLELVLADAYNEKHANKKEYNENEYLDNFIYSQKPEADITETEISLNGYTFELERSVPELGQYIGKNGQLLPTLRIVEKTTHSIKVEVIRSEGIKSFKYSYKEKGKEEFSQAVENASNTYTFEGLESDKIYVVKVECVKDGEKHISERIVQLGKIPSGKIKAKSIKWSNKEATVTIATEEEEYQIQWQKNGIEEGKWTTEKKGIKEVNIGAVKSGDNIYVRLFDGVNGGDYLTINIVDKVAPKVNIELVSDTMIVNISANAKVVQKDEESGINIQQSKWVCNTNSNEIIDEGEYMEKFTSENEEIKIKAQTEGTYYLHVLSIDNAGNKVQSISKPITVKPWEMGYVRDGLMVLYDGSNNTGNGHSNTTSTWKNLASNSFNGVLHGCTWGENYLSTDGIDDWVGIGLMKYPNVTIETVSMHGSSTLTYGVNNFDGGGIRIIRL